MALKTYLDGGNTADAQKHKVITLAEFSGFPKDWKKFDKLWKSTLRKYHAPWLHTTDAISLQGPFSPQKGWDSQTVERFIEGCVSVIEKCSTRVNAAGKFYGVRPSTVTVHLKDFKQAQAEIPDLVSVEHLCAITSTILAMSYGAALGAVSFELFFDQGEPFFGHIQDRMVNRESRRASKIWDLVVHYGQTDMRKVPALQAADLLAWTVNRTWEEPAIRYDWQERLYNLSRESEVFDYERLKKPIHEHIRKVKSWNLPRRRSMP
ncbi:MAG: hypothetical protein LAP38_13930 [Acidobacteriia bacterium]|nr:hypothetical protein [Terriglobia bacterium]